MYYFLHVQDAGVTVNFLIIGCYEGNEFFWTIVIFAYLVLLQLIGLILAVQTRKVKIKALNDSKSVAAVIYSTGIALVLLGVATFALGPYLNYGQILLNGTLTFGTYAFLGIIFVPKVKLYVLYIRLCCMCNYTFPACTDRW